MKKLFGVLCFLGGIAAALYFGLYLCLIGGIVQVIHSATPTVNAWGIAWGVARIVCTGIVSGISFWLCAVVGMGCFAASAPTR